MKAVRMRKEGMLRRYEGELLTRWGPKWLECWTFVQIADCSEVWPEPSDVWRRSYTLLILTSTYLLPLSVLSITYGLVIAKLWRRRTPGNADTARDSQQLKSKRRVCILSSHSLRSGVAVRLVTLVCLLVCSSLSFFHAVFYYLCCGWIKLYIMFRIVYSNCQQTYLYRATRYRYS